MNMQVKRIFSDKYFTLQGHTLQLAMLYQNKKKRIWKETQAKIQNQLEYVIEIQKHIVQEYHGIRMLNKQDIQEIN